MTLAPHRSPSQGTAPMPKRSHKNLRQESKEKREPFIEKEQTELLQENLDGIATHIEAYESSWSDDGHKYITKYIVEITYDFTP